MKILVIAEHNNETVKASTFSTINAASQIDQNIDVLVVGSDCNNVTSELSNTQYIKKILQLHLVVFLLEKELHREQVVMTLMK